VRALWKYSHFSDARPLPHGFTDDFTGKFFHGKMMKYDWNPTKNEWLKKERQISFEQIIIHFSRGDVWKVTDHPDQSSYPGQKMYFVNVNGYIYIVPYVVEKEYIFLKTIISSRKATKIYKEEQENQNEVR
jgi:uncharacterized DUF497 family protein